MTDEQVSIDAFTSEPRPAPPPHEPVPEPPEPDPEPGSVMGVVWVSKSSGAPHVVGVVADPRGFRKLTCTCPAYLGVLVGTHRACWAMDRTAQLLGWPKDWATTEARP